MKNTDGKIDIRDLRIGNLVISSVDGQEVVMKVTKIGCRSVHLNYPMSRMSGGYMRNDTDIRPIPITPEWLERLGLSNVVCVDSYENDNIVIQNDGLVVAIKSTNIEEEFIYIEHVHQLQNLVYALTGEELTIGESE